MKAKTVFSQCHSGCHNQFLTPLEKPRHFFFARSQFLRFCSKAYLIYYKTVSRELWNVREVTKSSSLYKNLNAKLYNGAKIQNFKQELLNEQLFKRECLNHAKWEI